MADLARWRALPKVELHLHLEGAAPPALIRDIAREKSVDLQRIFRPDGSYAFRDFVHFLEVYEAATSVLQTPEDFARLTTAVLEQSAADGVIYTEAFLSPDFCGGGDVDAWRDYLSAMAEAAESAREKHGIHMRGIVTCIRHFGPDKARRAARCAAETAGGFITGFGMAGDETRGAPRDFAYAFDMAREAELALTVHAGEWRGPAEVRAALDDLRPARIGHGVRAGADPALVARLAEERIHLEVCPNSNIALGVFPDMPSHPVEKLRKAGVLLSISTDDPPFFHTSLSAEYAALHAAFGWNEERFAACNAVALDAAFCDADTKSTLRERLMP
jgi:adenosine deaminase